MNLLIVSHTPHFKRGDELVGWGATVREIDHLAQLFSRTVHLAPLHTGSAPPSAIPYESSRVAFCPVLPSGGARLRDKFAIAAAVPTYWRTIRRELRQADVVQVRCPANLSLVAVVLLAFVRSPPCRWAKYAGNWCPGGREAWSYTFQRWWLRRGWHRGLVTVNGHWPNQPAHVHSFINPCLTDEELEQGRAAAAGKALSKPLRLIYVGRLESAKGAGRTLQVLASLKKSGCPAILDLVGDGPERPEFERLADTLQLSEAVKFHGWLPRPVLGPLYTQSHFMVLPTESSEGWPKVLSEAMAYGAVPLAGKVSSIPQLLASFATGKAIEPRNVEAFVRAIVEYSANAAVWREQSAKAVEAAAGFTYRHYVAEVQKLLGLKRNGNC